MKKGFTLAQLMIIFAIFYAVAVLSTAFLFRSWQQAHSLNSSSFDPSLLLTKQL